jgi:hypothetical protein
VARHSSGALFSVSVFPFSTLPPPPVLPCQATGRTTLVGNEEPQRTAAEDGSTGKTGEGRAQHERRRARGVGWFARFAGVSLRLCRILTRGQRRCGPLRTGAWGSFQFHTSPAVCRTYSHV